VINQFRAKFLRAAKAGGVGVRECRGGGLPGGNQLGEPCGFGSGFGERRETAQRAPAFAVRVVHDLKNGARPVVLAAPGNLPRVFVNLHGDAAQSASVNLAGAGFYSGEFHAISVGIVLANVKIQKKIAGRISLKL
jgi:hypothetical protein